MKSPIDASRFRRTQVQISVAPTLPDGMNDRFVESSAGRIHYVHGGRGSPLFLIHGGHGAWTHWYANLHALSKHHAVVAIDMPGFGQSADLHAARSLDGVSAATSAAIDAIRADLPAAERALPIQLGAFSFGTLVATAIALQRPKDVRSLLLINPPGLGIVSPEVKSVQARAGDAAHKHGMAAGLQVTLKELMLCQPARADAEALALLAWGVQNVRFVSRSVSRSTQLIPMLQALRMPAHIVLGANDPHQRHELEMRRDLLERTLGVKSVSVFDDAAHWLQYDQPDRFNALALSVYENAI